MPMDAWDEGGLEQQAPAIERAFRILRQGPPPLSQRQRQRGQQQTLQCMSVSKAAGEERALNLAVHPPLYPKESEGCRLARADARARCWELLEGSIKVGGGMREVV
jgi:hypothetical protein